MKINTKNYISKNTQMLECFLQWMAWLQLLWPTESGVVCVYIIIGNIVTLSFEAEPRVKLGWELFLLQPDVCLHLRSQDWNPRHVLIHALTDELTCKYPCLCPNKCFTHMHTYLSKMHGIIMNLWCTYTLVIKAKQQNFNLKKFIKISSSAIQYFTMNYFNLNDKLFKAMVAI